MSRRIYDVMNNNGLEDLVMVTMHSCGCTSQYSEYMFFEDEEDDWDSFYDYIYNNYGDMKVEQYVKHEIKDNVLYLYRSRKSVCSSCKSKEFRETIRYCDEQPRPIGFESVTIYRGLNAYYGEGTIEDIKRLFIRLIEHPEYQVCCSTNTIGDIGVVLEGEVIMASNRDLNTARDRHTHRRFYRHTPQRAEHIIYDARDLDRSKKDMNDEIVMQNVKIKAIWLSVTASDEAIQAAFDLEKEYGYEIIDVEQEF